MTGSRLSVVATAGHVDHGKSALIIRLTGIDPDRLAEEKRRGLTIDLGFAWTTLPSGREVGFVDVPGHERFIRNMLAGVGPVRLVLFVVAADEGWKPQSEEHLQIVDVLGVDGAVVALTKRDAVDEATAAARREEVRKRLAGTALADAAIVPCSSRTGEGVEEVRSALDAMIAAAPEPESSGRPRQFVDRVFTIHGAGTVVTGTLTGGPLRIGQEAELQPAGHVARIRGLQSHKRSLETAQPVSRVAVNLAGTTTAVLGRGDVLGMPGEWRPTVGFEAFVAPVRGLRHPVTERGAYKLYVGSAERDARLRLYDAAELAPGAATYARVTFAPPAVVDVGDRFVLREVGRRETVAGGVVLDVAPPSRGHVGAVERLSARRGAVGDRAALAALLVRERGAVVAVDVPVLTGGAAEDAERLGSLRMGPWLVSAAVRDEALAALRADLSAFHDAHPLLEGMDLADARAALAHADPVLREPRLADQVLASLGADGHLVRAGATVRLPEHRPSTEGRADADGLVRAVLDAEPSPPTVRELVAAGFPMELVAAACADRRLVRVSPELVFTPGLVRRAEEAARELAAAGELTVSAFREALGTSRKYALPILEHFDRIGLTRREGDRRAIRS